MAQVIFVAIQIPFLPELCALFLHSLAALKVWPLLENAAHKGVGKVGGGRRRGRGKEGGGLKGEGEEEWRGWGGEEGEE